MFWKWEAGAGGALWIHAESGRESIGNGKLGLGSLWVHRLGGRGVYWEREARCGEALWNHRLGGSIRNMRLV